MRVLGISGSLRRGSYNTQVLREAARLLPADVEFTLFDGLKEVPPYDEDDDVQPAPAAVARLRDAIAGADAVLFSTPEYNSSLPGQLKNAIDWASRPRELGSRREARGHPPHHRDHGRCAAERRLLRAPARPPTRQEDGQPGRPDRLPPLLRRRGRQPRRRPDLLRVSRRRPRPRG